MPDCSRSPQGFRGRGQRPRPVGGRHRGVQGDALLRFPIPPADAAPCQGRAASRHCAASPRQAQSASARAACAAACRPRVVICEPTVSARSKLRRPRPENSPSQGFSTNSRMQNTGVQGRSSRLAGTLEDRKVCTVEKSPHQRIGPGAESRLPGRRSARRKRSRPRSGPETAPRARRQGPPPRKLIDEGHDPVEVDHLGRTARAASPRMAGKHPVIDLQHEDRAGQHETRQHRREEGHPDPGAMEMPQETRRSSRLSRAMIVLSAMTWRDGGGGARVPRHRGPTRAGKASEAKLAVAEALAGGGRFRPPCPRRKL